MIRILIYIIFLSFNLHPIGFEALSIPSNSIEMSLSGAGVAAQYSESVNPSTNINKLSKIGFSANKWITDINGSSFYYTNNDYRITYSSFKANDIEVRNNIPSDEPIDIIESNFLSFGISKGCNLPKNFKLGIGAKFNYSQLFIDQIYTLTFDLGLQNQLTENIQAGILIQNIGLDNLDIPTKYGIGLSYYLSKTKTEFLLDYINTKYYDAGISLGITQTIKMLTLNVGYSQFSNFKTTFSSGIKINLNKKYNFLYSLLSIENSNFGFAHYFGFEISL